MVAMINHPLRIDAAASAAHAAKGAERRICPRREVSGHVEGMRTDHTVEARSNPRLSLTLRDLSVGGLCAISDKPLAAGERLSVFFPPQGARRGWDAQGRVLRCTWSESGYKVAVEFDALPLAA